MKPDRVRDALRAQLTAQQAVLVAFSGGLDSTVLLEALVQLRAAGRPDLRLRAAYVHHGLSAHADSWAEHCRQQCLLRGVTFLCLPVQVDAAAGGIEAAARAARYQALAAALLPDEVLVTAQHQDDQAETLLLALKRGSGPAGLSAMAASAPFGQQRLLRPLLGLNRSALAQYAADSGLEWIEDDSNADDRFDRNFLRLHILPLLSLRWPGFSQAAARSARLCAEQESVLDELLAESLAQLIRPDGALSLVPMIDFNAARRNALLRRWLASHRLKMPAMEQLDRLWHTVALARPDALPQLQLGLHLIRRYRDHLFVVSPGRPLAADLLLWPASADRLELPDGLGQLRRILLPATAGKPAPAALTASPAHLVMIRLRAPRCDEQVTVRFGLQGSLHIVGRHRGRPAKKIWQELGVPPWLRDRTPVLFYNQTPMAAIGVFICQSAQPVEGMGQWQVEWHQFVAGGEGDGQ